MSFICRICLAGGNTSLHSVENKKLRSLYEKLTNAKFNSDDARPKVLCCFCYQKLLRCYTFTQMAVRSEKLFSHVYDGLEVTQDYSNEVKLNLKHNLSVATMPFINIDGNTTQPDSQVSIKEEPLPSTDIKEKVITESDKLLEMEYFSEDSTKTRFKFEEDYKDSEKDVKGFLSNIQIDPSKPVESFNIKEEPLCISIEIKEETNIDSDEFQEVRYFSENSTISRLTFEEHYTNQEKDAEEFLGKIHTEQNKLDDSKMPFSCNSCYKTFNIKSKLISHIRNSHSQVEEKLYSSSKKHTETTCMIEDKTINNRKNKQICKECDKSFCNKSSLIRHLRCHTGEKPYSCTVCENQFNRRSTLVLHMRRHTGEKPFACNVCAKQFSQKGNLSKHMSTHKTQKHPNLINPRRGKTTRHRHPYD